MSRPPRVLFIIDKMITPQHDGGSLRVYHALALLRELGCAVTFAAHYPRSFEPFNATLAADTARLEAAGIQVAAARPHLAEHGAEYDLVILSPYNVAYHYLQAVRAQAPQAAAVYMALDLAHLQHLRRARRHGNVPDLRRALEAKQWETWLAHHADVTLACSPAERDVMLKLCPTADVRVLSHLVEPQPGAAPFAARRDLLFVGSFPHVANVDAMLYFTQEIFPAVRAALPEAQLRIVGTAPPEEIQRLAGPHITVPGHVPDLGPEYARARVSLAPLRHGAGIKIKILESLGRGVPVVMTDVGAEGLPIVGGEHGLIANSPSAFAAAVIRLYTDAALWDRLRRNGLALLAEYYSPRAMQSVLRGVLETAGRKAAAHAGAH
jgi:glycosyltransferase involved in cell wall biosynthesis